MAESVAADPLETGLFLLATFVLATLGWGRVLWYFDERSPRFHRAVLFALVYTRRTAGEVRALLLSALYYGYGLLTAVAYAVASDLDLTVLFAVSVDHPPLVVLGAIAQISLAALLVDLFLMATRAGPERFAELRSIPWMEGLRALPAAAVPWGAALGAAIEELFFRGVLITLFVTRFGFTPLAAVAVAGVLFCLQQLVQVRTGFQAAVIGAGSVAISLVGGLLVAHGGSVVPAVLCHCAFVVFYLHRGAETPQIARR